VPGRLHVGFLGGRVPVNVPGTVRGGYKVGIAIGRILPQIKCPFDRVHMDRLGAEEAGFGVACELVYMGLQAPEFATFPTDRTFHVFVLVGISRWGRVCYHDVFYQLDVLLLPRLAPLYRHTTE
jgi:hypothetical protein